MSVSARFWIRDFTRFGNTENIRVVMAPVVRAHELPGGEGNVDWSKYTPSGEITLNITALGAQEWFEQRIGKDVAITFDDPES